MSKSTTTTSVGLHGTTTKSNLFDTITSGAPRYFHSSSEAQNKTAAVYQLRREEYLKSLEDTKQQQHNDNIHPSTITPLIKGKPTVHIKKKCIVCNTEPATVTCAICGETLYCSDTDRDIDFKSHKFKCKGLKLFMSFDHVVSGDSSSSDED